MNHMARDNDESDKLLREYFMKNIDWMHCQHYIVMLIIKAISCGVLSDVNVDLAEQMFDKTTAMRMEKLSYFSCREDRAKQRYIRLCKNITIFFRVMQLYFLEGSLFYNQPFNMMEQFPMLEGTLVCSEQFALFAFSLMKDEWCNSLYDEIVDAIYLLYVHPNAPKRQKYVVDENGVQKIEKGQPVPIKGRAITIHDTDEQESSQDPKRQKLNEGAPAPAGPSTAGPSTTQPTMYRLHWEHKKYSNAFEALDVLAGEIVSFCDATSSTGAILFDRKAVKEALHVLTNTQKNSLMVLSTNPLDEKYELIMDASLFDQIKAFQRDRSTFQRTRHRSIMTLCNHAIKFKHADPGPYILGTGYTFKMPLSPKMKMKHHADNVTRVLAQFPGVLRKMENTNAYPDLNAMCRRPTKEHMRVQFKSMKMVVDDNSYHQASMHRYTENPCASIQKKRLEALGIGMDLAKEKGLLLFRPADEREMDGYLQRLVPSSDYDVMSNRRRQAIEEAITSKTLA
jgi:hypothetical protein